MRRQYDPAFIKALKKTNIRIRKSFREKIVIFAKNPQDSQLNNHKLKEKYEGYRSIDITGDYRAIYEEINEVDEPIAYFFLIGTHNKLYSKIPKEEHDS